MKSELLDRLPPSDTQAEAALLGACIVGPRQIDDVASIIKPEDFYSEQNAILLRNLLTMRDQRIGIDHTTLPAHLIKTGELESVGGLERIIDLIRDRPTVTNTTYYAKIIKEKSQLRKLIEISTETIRACYSGTTEPQNIIDSIETQLIDADTVTYSGTTQFSDSIIEALDQIDLAYRSKKQFGIPTGIPEYDQFTGGLFRGELTIIAARPSVGKTSFACQIASYNGLQGRLVYFVSLEQSHIEITTRILCTQANVSGQLIRQARLSDNDFRLLAETSNVIGKANIRFDDRPSLTVNEIARTARRHVRDGLSLIIIDYLTLITPSSENKKEIREQQVAKMARALKQLARELKIPIVCLAQLNRAAEGEKGKSQRPRLSNLRESGAIEQDADSVIFLHVPDFTRREDVELILAKQRNGETMEMGLTWFKETTRYEYREIIEDEPPRENRKHYWQSPIKNHHGKFTEFDKQEF